MMNTRIQQFVIVFSMISLLACQLPLFAQNFSLEAFPETKVHIDGRKLLNPFVGGLAMPRFSTLDINNDQLEDLIIFESVGNKLLPFLAVEEGSTQYIYSPEYESIFPEISGFLYFIDYNCDGIKDLFTSKLRNPAEGVLRIYKGLSLSNPAFEQVDFRTVTLELEVLLESHSFDIPTINDVNGDGDFDILLFPRNETHIHYFENQTIERGYACDSLIFDLYEDCWGEVGYSLSEGIEMEICPMFHDNSSFQSRNSCAGSFLLSYDFDNDQDADVLFSSLYFRKLFQLQNGGSNLAAQVTLIEPEFLSNQVDKLPSFPAPYLIDIGNDQQLDLVVASNRYGAVVTGSTEDQFMYFTNTGSNAIPEFELSNTKFLVDDMIDEGFRSSIASFDYNSDGLMDLLIAGNTHNPYFSYTSHLSLYENTGTPEQPAFIRVEQDFAGLLDYSLKAVHPALGDLDADGDVDMIIGDNIGKLYYFENTSIGSITSSFALHTEILKEEDVGSYARPQLTDMNDDGLLDLIVGSHSGRISFFLNTGQANAPTFELQTDAAGQLFIDSFNMESCPWIFKSDTTEGLWMLNGLRSGNLELYRIIDDDFEKPFELINSQFNNLNVGNSSTISMADMNNDGKPELLLGNERGGINIFSLTTVETTSTFIPQSSVSFSIYPNPANRQLNIQLSKNSSEVQIRLFNPSGLLCKEWSSTAQKSLLQFDISRLPLGLYLCTIQTTSGVFTKKILIE